MTTLPPFPAPLLVWGHRGHRHHRIPYLYPNACFENSLQAFAEAFRDSMGVECDVIRSKNDTAYMAHDMDTLPSGVTVYEMHRNIDDKSAKFLGERMLYQIDDDAVAQLRLKDGQEVPSLEKLLHLMKEYPDRTLVIELKGPQTNNAALTQIDKAIAQHWIRAEQVIFSSFNLPALAQLRKTVGTRFKIGALFDMDMLSLTQMYPDWPGAPQDAFYVPFLPEANVLDLPCLQEMQPDYIHLERGSLWQGGLDAIAAKFPDAKIVLWTSGEPHPDDDSILIDTIRQFAPSGKLHAVISDFPEIVQRKLKALGL